MKNFLGVCRWVLLAVACMQITGCAITKMYRDSRRVREVPRMESVLVAKDGTTAIAFKSSYYRIPIFNFKGDESQNQDDRKQPVKVLNYPERLRYVVLKPEAITGALQNISITTATGSAVINRRGADAPWVDGSPHGIEMLSMVDPNGHIRPRAGLLLQEDPKVKANTKIFPSDFRGPDATQQMLPEIFRSEGVTKYKPDDQIPYSNEFVDGMVRFSDWRFTSDRNRFPKRYYPVIPYLMLTDAILLPAATVAVLATGVILSPVALVSWILDPPASDGVGSTKTNDTDKPTNAEPSSVATPALANP